MNVEFVRFEATDGVELQGWLSEQPGDLAAVHLHGMSGNGYENRFLDNLREMYNEAGMSFFTIDTRGRGIISSFWLNGQGDPWGEGTKLGGSCFEIFEESAQDIQGALDFLKSRGKSKFILQGHSLGCTKVVNYLVQQTRPDIMAVILLAPTDMTGWASTEPRHQEYLSRAKQLLTEGKAKELVDAQCWLDKTPLSAQTYPTICEAGSSADIYGEREGGPLLGRIDVPTLILYGDDDIGITRIDGNMDGWLTRINKFKNANTQIEVIKGASHGFAGHEEVLAGKVRDFLSGLSG